MYGVHVTTSLIQGHGHTEEVKSHMTLTAMEETFAFVRKTSTLPTAHCWVSKSLKR